MVCASRSRARYAPTSDQLQASMVMTTSAPCNDGPQQHGTLCNRARTHPEPHIWKVRTASRRCPQSERSPLSRSITFSPNAQCALSGIISTGHCGIRTSTHPSFACSPCYIYANHWFSATWPQNWKWTDRICRPIWHHCSAAGLYQRSPTKEIDGNVSLS